MGAGTGFRVVGSELLVETPFLRVEQIELECPDGTVTARSVVRIGGAVASVAVDGDEVVLIRQYRTPLDRALLELPAGKLDVPGEEPRVAAARELAEEVGLVAGNMELISHYHTSPGYADEFVLIYLATDLTPVEMNRIGPEEEAAEIVRVPIEDIPQMLPSIEDSKTVIGLQALLLLRAGVGA